MKILQTAFLIAVISMFAGCTKNITDPATDASSLNKQVKTGLAAFTGSPAGDVVGKVVVGYQGWFSAAGDNSPSNSWNHTNLEMWPDQREYKKLYVGCPFGQNGVGEPPFFGNLGNGTPAGMYSAYDSSTVNLHFKWMNQYGIDCAALQRFANEIDPGSTLKAQRDSVASRVRNAAQTYGRKFYIEYDASGQSDMTVLENDWTNTIVGALKLTSSPNYAKQNGKLVVQIYGLGQMGQGTSVTDAIAAIQWFQAHGCYVIGGVPGGWRTASGFSVSGFMAGYEAFNMISPWAVGGVVDGNYEPSMLADLDTCNAHGIDYLPVSYPGTAFSNSNGMSVSPRNEIPRNHGNFMWSQLAVMRQLNISSVFVAMFDEMNEATSIFKVAEDSTMIPAGNYFLTLDADGTHVSSDFYLRLVNDGGNMLKGNTPFMALEPTPFTTDGTSSGPLANGNYTITNDNSGLVVDVVAQLTAPGSAIDQWQANGGTNQQWTLTNLGNGRYKIIGVQSGLCLDVTGSSTTAGAKLVLNTYTGAASQQWVISTTSGGFFSVLNAGSGDAMEISAFSTTAGTLIDQWTSDGGTNQQWAIKAL